jgi:hypothetical protein
MSRSHVTTVGVAMILLVSMSAASSLYASPQRATEGGQLIPGTELKVLLPTDWRIEPAPKELGQRYALKHVKAPEYAVVFGQSKPGIQGHSCTEFTGAMLADRSVGATVIPRPNFVPETYFGSVLVIPNLHVACLDMGDTLFSVMIYLKTGAPMPGVLTELLTMVADTAREQALVITAPGRLWLPLLGIEIPIRADAWGFQQISDTWGKTNVLRRTSKAHTNELMITPFIFPGHCNTFMRTPPFGGSKLEKNRNYGGDHWHPDALEGFPPPFKGLLAYACHNLDQYSVLMARIEYEKPVVTDADMAVIRQMLNDIGQAVDLKQAHK